MERILEKELYKWKSSKNRYPLLLRGARQVGKTHLIEKFGRKEFESFVSLNFEAQPEAIACFASLNPEEIILRLQTILKKTIEPGKTLLFLDEIQACPKAIVSLRYFKEKFPSLHIIGAGSLLEFALIQGKFSFPVGRVQFIHLKPLSFQEYLLARGKNKEYEKLKICSLISPPDAQLHQDMLKLVKEYFFIGGMPAAVSDFCQLLSFEEVKKIQEILLSTYQADFSKYATTAEQKYLKTLFQEIFPLIAKHFKYSKIDPDIRSRELKTALDYLQWAGLFHCVYLSSAAGFPLAFQKKQSRFTVLFVDIGLMQHGLKANAEDIFATNFFQINDGALAEQFVGQELLAYCDPYREEKLFYWERAKKGSDAEIDYLYPMDSQIFPVEVKAGPYGRLKSLQEFIKEKKSPLGLQISQKPLSLEKRVLSVPFYLIHQLPRLIKKVL